MDSSFFPVEYVPFDLLVAISDLLVDRDALRFFSTCVYLGQCKDKRWYKKQANLSIIWGVSYYDRLTSMSMSGPDLIDLKKCLREKRIQRNIFPPNLEKLELYNFKGDLKTYKRQLPNLKMLVLKHMNKKMQCKVSLKAGCFPGSLTHLTWETNQELKPNFLPEGLRVLKVNYYCYSTMSLPSSLEHLYIGNNNNYEYCFNRIYPGMLPLGLKSLTFDCRVNFVATDLPENLESIHFNKNACRSSFYRDIIFEEIPEHIRCIYWDRATKTMIARINNSF